MSDEMLEPSESLDSDEVRNDDGDAVADPPEEWIEPDDDETLDERLAAEVPDVSPDDVPVTESAIDLDRIDPTHTGRDRGQIGGTPEDGESFYDIVD